MSMENAILAHAAALTALAEAIKSMSGGGAPLLASVIPAELTAGTETTVRGSTREEAMADEIPGKKSRTGKAEVKAESAETATGTVDQAAIDKAAADAKATTTDTDTGGDESEAMDYATAKPRLLAVVKRVGKDKVQALIKTYGVDKADQVDPSKLADLVAKAEAL